MTETGVFSREADHGEEVDTVIFAVDPDRVTEAESVASSRTS